MILSQQSCAVLTPPHVCPRRTPAAGDCKSAILSVSKWRTGRGCVYPSSLWQMTPSLCWLRGARSAPIEIPSCWLVARDCWSYCVPQLVWSREVQYATCDPMLYLFHCVTTSVCSLISNMKHIRIIHIIFNTKCTKKIYMLWNVTYKVFSKNLHIISKLSFLETKNWTHPAAIIL